MEAIESKDSPTQSETSSQIRQLEAATFCLRRRKDVVQQYLKKPGLTADRVRLRDLLRELEQICRALRGQSFGQTEHIRAPLARYMASEQTKLGYEGTR